MASDSSPTLFTIPPGEPFLDVLAGALVADPTLGGVLSDGPHALSDLTILLPTRRAVGALCDAFLRAGGGRATLLPRIRPLGDVDEEELMLNANEANGFAGGLDLPVAVEAIDRQLRLARLVLVWGKGSPFGPWDAGQAAALAAELAHLIDSAETEGIDLARVRDLVPDRFAEHWQHTLAFLQIALEYWPAELKERGLIDPAMRRNLAIRAEAEAWAANPPRHPVIAAGSTGSIPATAELLSTVARLPKGAVILPGLDQALDARGWEAVGPSHPQYGMKQLLGAMGSTRDNVRAWAQTKAQTCPRDAPSPIAEARTRLLSEALRPAETTDAWSRPERSPVDLDEAMEGLTLLEAPTPREEAGAIALALREVLETPARTGILITPDRTLARRVARELGRWNILIDDSAGVPLTTTPPFGFLRLIAVAMSEALAPVALLDVLKHPLAALGLAPAECRRRARRLEQAILRGPRPGPGIAGLRNALAQMRNRREPVAPLVDLIDRLEAALAPLLALYDQSDVSLEALAQVHLAAGEALAADGDHEGAARLYGGEAGEATALFMETLLAASGSLEKIFPPSYLHLLETLGAGRTVRPRFGQHPRLAILGPLEARLLSADLIVLGGLNEEVWPASAPLDAWLSRPMRADLGLEPPERRIGLAAHDFQQAACGERVLLTRALKVEGTPTVASRWLLRLQSLLKGLGAKDGLVPDRRLLHIAERLDAPPAVDPVLAPAPAPPLEARPTSYSVTEVETLIRDPYALYAKKILCLRPLDPLDADAGALERGIVLHAALEAFGKRYPERLPEDLEAAFLAVGKEVFAKAPDRPAVKAFWWPRFRDVAAWLAVWERDVRGGMTHTHAEIKGTLQLDGFSRALTLSATADRIDERNDGTVAIYDYKTGALPTKKQVEANLSPQLPLEAAIAQSGGFTRGDGTPLPAGPVGPLAYLHLSGGKPGASERIVATDGSEAGANALAGLIRLLQQYEDEATPFLSRPRVQFQRRAGAYDHLARVLEWSAAGGEGEG